MGRDIISLEAEDLRRLAKFVYYQEVGNVQKIEYQSEAERRKQLDQSKACYKKATGLLDTVEDLIKEYVLQEDPKYTLAHTVFENTRRTVNVSIQFLRSWKVRMDSLDSATKHTQSLIKRLRIIDPQDTTSIINMQADLIRYDKAMVEFAQEQSQFLVRYASKGYNKLSVWINNEQLTFGSLLERFKTKLGFEGPFKNLPREQQTQVFQKILEAGGRKKTLATVVSDVFGAVGVLCLVAAAGTMVWDIYSSDNKLLTAAHDVVEIGSAIIGSIIARMVVKEVLEVVGEEAAIVLGLPLGPVGEFFLACAVTYAVSKVGDWVVDELFSLFGKKEDHPKPEPAPPAKQISTTSVSVVMPNARAMAYQIAYRRKST